MKFIKKLIFEMLGFLINNITSNKMSVDEKVEKFFRDRDQLHPNKCNELQGRIQWLIDNPGEHRNTLVKFGSGTLARYPNNCSSVDLFIKRHNEDHPRLQVYLDKSDYNISHVKTEIDDRQKNLKYTIH